jgi:hypothetical protein
MSSMAGASYCASVVLNAIDNVGLVQLAPHTAAIPEMNFVSDHSL